LSAELTKTHSFRLFFFGDFDPLARLFYSGWWTNYPNPKLFEYAN